MKKLVLISILAIFANLQLLTAQNRLSGVFKFSENFQSFKVNDKIYTWTGIGNSMDNNVNFAFLQQNGNSYTLQVQYNNKTYGYACNLEGQVSLNGLFVGQYVKSYNVQGISSEGSFNAINNANRNLNKPETPSTNSIQGTFVLQFELNGTASGTLDGDDRSQIKILFK